MKKPLCSVQDAQQCYLYNSGEWEISVRTLVPRFFASVAQLGDGRAFVFEWVDTHATASCWTFQSFNKEFFPRQTETIPQRSMILQQTPSRRDPICLTTLLPLAPSRSQVNQVTASLLCVCCFRSITQQIDISAGNVFITGGAENSDRAFIIEVDTGILLYDTRYACHLKM